MRTVKIISDGTAEGTKLVDEQTGESIGYVTHLSWEVGVNTKIATATVTIVKVPVDMVNIEMKVV